MVSQIDEPVKPVETVWGSFLPEVRYFSLGELRAALMIVVFNIVIIKHNNLAPYVHIPSTFMVSLAVSPFHQSRTCTSLTPVSQIALDLTKHGSFIGARPMLRYTSLMQYADTYFILRVRFLTNYIADQGSAVPSRCSFR